jgi:hypothetical protein
MAAASMPRAVTPTIKPVNTTVIAAQLLGVRLRAVPMLRPIHFNPRVSVLDNSHPLAGHFVTARKRGRLVQRQSGAVILDMVRIWIVTTMGLAASNSVATAKLQPNNSFKPKPLRGSA